jgi:hypothetical protein
MAYAVEYRSHLLWRILLALGVFGSAAATPTVPVIFVPGYASSSPQQGTILKYALNRGANPKTLDLSPSYALFVRSLTT